MSLAETLQDNYTVTVLQEYGPFLAWLHKHGVVKFSPPGISGKLEPRIQGLKVLDEMCVRLYVPRKLSEADLHPNSTAEWEVLYNTWKQGEAFFNLPGTKQLRIPVTIAGYPTDVVEA